MMPLVLAACLGPLAGTPPPGDVADAAVSTDVRDVPPPPPDVTVVPSGCPSPARVSPSMVPSTGFLPAVRGRFARSVDGDTAHFVIPIEGDITVRMLWVNTEESHGEESTAFGVRTASALAQVLTTVREFAIVRQADPRNPMRPRLDPYMRQLAMVFADGELYATRIIRDGWTAYYTDFGCAPEPMHSSMLFAEAEARANRRGIWVAGHPTNYAPVFARWITDRCRPNPFLGQPYCM